MIYEFLRVVTHPRVFAQPWSVGAAWPFVGAILESPVHRVLVQNPRHATIAEQTIEEHPELRGNLLHDAHTAILLREHGVERIYTRDADFRSFRFLEVLDPLKIES